MFHRFFILLILCSVLSAENSYQLGEGVQIDELPIFVGGYISTDYRYKDEEHRFRVDDIALLSYGNYKALSYMAEVEFKEFYVLTQDKDSTHTEQDNKLYIERLYLDYAFSDALIGRAGKYNTPIGFWNLLPINILRDTSSNPITNELLYPKFTTGFGMEYNSFDEGEFKLDLMLQHNDSLDNDYNNYEIDAHYGLGLSYEYDSYLIKLNTGYFHKINILEDDFAYALLSGKYEDDMYKLMGEFGSQYSKEKSDFIYSGYLQGLYHFNDKHAGILRLEYLNNTDSIDDNIAVFAYTYRPLYAIALKSEYQLHSKDDSDQFIFSFSVLF